MSEFFTNLLDRHLGTCYVVKPRSRSLFETESVGSATPLPTDLSETYEIVDKNLERQDIKVRISENHSIGPTVYSLKPQRINTELKLPPGNHTNAADAMSHNLERQDDLIRSTANDSILADVNALGMKAHLGTPLSERQDRQPVKPKPFEQTNPHEEAHAHTAEFDYRMEDELDNRIRDAFAGLQGHHKAWSAEHPKTNNLDRTVVTRIDNTEDSEKAPDAQPLLVVPLYDESEKVDSSESDQKRQYAFDSDKRDISIDGLLEPPTWFFDMQNEFNRRWNRLNRKSQAEPVINVTIGRIEVKANLLRESKQPRQRKKPSGVMSLDKYLSQFGRGGRG